MMTWLWRGEPLCVVLAVCLWKLGVAAPSLQAGDIDTDTQLWLADEAFYDDVDVYNKPQGDQAAKQPLELCPPVPATLPDGSCQEHKCTSDRECGDSGARKCCYNGCVYTCLPELAPAAFLDWLREPRRRLSSGLSWLVTGPDEANEEEPCSTSPVDSDADPLLCPEGYFCSLRDNGDLTRGIPNQGICLKLADEDTDDADSELLTTDRREGDQPVKHPHACDLGGRMLLEGHVLTQDGKQCICKRRQLVCEEGEKD